MSTATIEYEALFEQLAQRNDELLEANRRLSEVLDGCELKPEVLVTRLNLDTPSPARLTPGSAGWDLVTTETMEIMPGERRMFPLGIKMAIPEGYAGTLWPRSGLAHHHGIDRLAGLIDADYRGEAKAILINHGNKTLRLNSGERICQLVVVPVLTRMVEVDELPGTDRGAGGFGSTGR